MDSSSPKNWDLDSDEIASIASEDLFANRPNRWTGPRSTWESLTRPDREIWDSLKQLHDRDLAVHLYNAHVLGRSGGGIVVDPVGNSPAEKTRALILGRTHRKRRSGHRPSHGPHGRLCRDSWR